MNNGWLKLDDKTFVYEYSRTLRLVYLLLGRHVYRVIVRLLGR